MEQIISKEELDKINEVQGEIRGLSFKIIEDFVLKEEGAEGLKKIKEVIAGLNFPRKDEKIRATDFYPLSLFSFKFLVMQKLFHYNDKKLQEIGSFRAKSSLLTRLFMRYFVSLEKVEKEAQEMWRKTTTVGNIEVVKVNEKEKHIVLRLKNYNLHPDQCHIFKGLFSTIIQMIVKDPVVCEETKCIFLGDSCHEFSLKW